MTSGGWHVVGRGFNGWHATKPDTSLSGAYGENRGAELAAEAIEGALVYDAKDADYSAFMALILRGPMLCCRCEPTEVDSFSDHAALAVMLPGLSDGFESIAKTALAGYSSLDKVGVDVYRGLLAKIPGVRLGKVTDGKIVWDA